MADPVDHNQAEPSDISAALDVERLDLNLYRSRNLRIPYAARGAFGGQVISQALVAATKCVKSEFLLHVSPRSLSQHPFALKHHSVPAVYACTFLFQVTRLVSAKAKRVPRDIRPISFSAHLCPCRCSIMSIDCATDVHTQLAPCALCRMDGLSLSCYAPFKYRRCGSRLAIGLCLRHLPQKTARTTSYITSVLQASQT